MTGARFRPRVPRNSRTLNRGNNGAWLIALLFAGALLTAPWLALLVTAGALVAYVATRRQTVRTHHADAAAAEFQRAFTARVAQQRNA